MAEADENASAAGDAASAKKGKGKLLLILAPVLLLLGGGGGAVMFVPAVHKMVLGGGGASAAKTTEAANATAKPFFVDMPEITVTLPNAGRPRQMKVKLALELTKQPVVKEGEHPVDLLTPRISDGLVLYLRTLRDADVDGALSVDRMRGDIQRRLDLLLGEGVVRDVLITSLVLG